MRVDKIGFCTSSLCAVHCLITPLILMWSGGLGLFSFLGSQVAEIVILTFTVLVGVLALVPSLFRHQCFHPMALFTAGMIIIATSGFVSMEWMSVAMSVLGASFLAYAHFENLRLNNQNTNG